MDAFNFAFSLFGLLLGFTLVEVLSGLVRVLKARKRLRIGWLTPLLASFVMMDLLSWWTTAWQWRAIIPASYGVMLFGMIVASTYYYAASQIFPDAPADGEDLDAHYLAHRRQVLGVLTILNAITFGVVIWRGGQALPMTQAVLVAGYFAAMIAAVASGRRWINAVALAALNLNYLIWAFFA